MKNNKLLVLDEILYKNLAPWLDKNNPDEKFHDLIDEVKVIKPEFQYLYEFSFIRPFNKKTKYYKKLIINETTSYCNKVIDIINSCRDSKEVKYLINDTLNKKLKTRLKDIGKVINEKGYNIIFINSKNTPFNTDIDHKTNTYIVQLLKTALIKIYMEIQKVFKSFINEDNIFILEDFYTQLLFEAIPNKFHLKEIVPPVEIKEEKAKPVQPPPSKKDTTHNSFTYINFDSQPDNIGDLHDSLISKSLISSNTTLPNLRKVFSGKPLTKPIVWTGNISELNYFIKLIHNINKSVENLKQQHWEVAVKCFVDSDGKKFDRARLKEQKKPKATAELIEQAANHLA